MTGLSTVFAVVITLSREGDKAALSVHKRGNEIAKDEQSHLFDSSIVAPVPGTAR